MKNLTDPADRVRTGPLASQSRCPAAVPPGAALSGSVSSATVPSGTVLRGVASPSAVSGRAAPSHPSRGTAARPALTGLGRAAFAAFLFVAVALLSVMPAGAAISRIDVNTASVEALAQLPGIGQSKAAAIAEERAKKPFGSVDELQRVSGIGASTLEKLRGHVRVAPPK